MPAFLVGAFRIKEPDYYSHSFFSLRQRRMRRIVFQFVQLNLGNASKLLQRALFHFSLFKRNIQNWTRLKGPLSLSIFFSVVTFSEIFCLESPPSSF